MKTLFKGQTHYRIFRKKPDGNVIDISLSNNGTRVETQFRYFMIAVRKVYSGDLIQFCKLRFYNGSNPNNCYQWCNNMISFDDISDYVEGIKWAGATGTSGEELINGLIGMGAPNDEVEGKPGTYYSYGKLCYDKILSYSSDTRSGGKLYKKYEIIDGQKCACFAYDIDRMNLGRRIDIQTYNKWCWYSANDTYSNKTGGQRNMSSFDLYMSNDRKNWQLMDTKNDLMVPSGDNFTLIYSNNIYPHYTIDEKTQKKKYTTIELNI